MTDAKLTVSTEAREGWRPYMLLGAVLIGIGLVAWRPIPVGVWHDDGVYALVGKALADGQGMTYQGVVDAPPAAKFPPVYPAVVALLWRILGDIGSVTLAATLLNVAFLAGAGVLLARALRTGATIPRNVSLLAGGLAVISAEVLRTSSAMLSEPLFLLLAGAALAVWPGAVRQGREGVRHRRVLAVILVLAIATRAAGLALVVGFGMASWIALGAGAAAVVALPALGSWIGWSLWARQAARGIPEDLADLLGPYGGWLVGQLLRDPVSFLARLPEHGISVVGQWGALMLPRLGGPLFWPSVAVLVALVAVGWAVARRRFPPLAWSTLAYAGLLLAWPYLDRRLMVPLHVMTVALLGVAAAHLLRRVRGRRSAAFVGVLLGVWAGYYGVTTSVRIAEGWPTAGYRIRAERMATAVEAMRRVVPPDAVVGAPEFWAGLHLHGGWTVAPSVRFDPSSTDSEAPSWGSPEAQERLWRRAGIEYLLLEQGGTLHGAALDRVEARCPGALAVLARMPAMMVVRLPWAGGGTGCPPDP